MAINVMLPIPAPTGLSATLQSGGSLLPNTTYYYIVVAGQKFMTPQSTINAMALHSPISAEGSFTTTTTELSALISWTAPTVSSYFTPIYYNVILTTVSGDYVNKRAVVVPTNAEHFSTLTATSLLVTTTTGFNRAIHSCQLKEQLVNGLSKDTGILAIELYGSDVHSIKDVYDAIVAAGYSSYVYYDGINFSLKGHIFTDSSNLNPGDGSLVVGAKNITFVKGGIRLNNPSYIFRFGSRKSDSYGADYRFNPCMIEIQNGRQCLFSNYDGCLQVYGSLLTIGRTVYQYYSTRTSNYYSFQQGYITRYISEIKDSIVGLPYSAGPGRAILGDVKDLKWGERYWSGNNKIRLKIPSGSDYLHAGPDGGFYNCFFIGDINPVLVAYSSSFYKNYERRFYDCVFNGKIDNMLVGNKIVKDISAGEVYSPTYPFIGALRFYSSVKLKIVDENNIPIQGATINVIDKNNNNVTWYFKDGTDDEIVDGTSSINNLTTDSLGSVDAYLESHYFTKDNTDSSTYAWIRNENFPFTISIIKSGYETYQTVSKLTEKLEQVITLKTQVPLIVTPDDVYVKKNPANIGANRDLAV